MHRARTSLPGAPLGVLCASFALALALACSSSSNGNGGGSQQGASLTCGGPPHICYEYLGSYWTESNVRSLCDATGQSGFRGTPCPTDARVGGCRYYPSQKSDHEIKLDYYSPDFTQSSAHADCDSLSGDWAP